MQTPRAGHQRQGEENKGPFPSSLALAGHVSLPVLFNPCLLTGRHHSAVCGREKLRRLDSQEAQEEDSQEALGAERAARPNPGRLFP